MVEVAHISSRTEFVTLYTLESMTCPLVVTPAAASPGARTRVDTLGDVVRYINKMQAHEYPSERTGTRRPRSTSLLTGLGLRGDLDRGWTGTCGLSPR